MISAPLAAIGFGMFFVAVIVISGWMELRTIARERHAH